MKKATLKQMEYMKSLVEKLNSSWIAKTENARIHPDDPKYSDYLLMYQNDHYLLYDSINDMIRYIDESDAAYETMFFTSEQASKLIDHLRLATGADSFYNYLKSNTKLLPRESRIGCFYAKASELVKAHGKYNSFVELKEAVQDALVADLDKLWKS